ncbi:MAG: hypothetical protein WCI22_03800 [Actinomycetota bacterium]
MDPARALAAALEPIAGQVYFSPECHAGYAALGFAPSAREANGVALPDGPAYFTSRGSLMGQVPGELVAAAFAVFNPEVVVPSVTFGWTLTDAATVCAARDEGAIAQLRRVLGPQPEGVGRARELLERAVAPLRPEGRPLYAGVLSQPMPDDDLGAVWRLCDLLREFRGDCHTAAWISAGFDATEIGLLSELYWGLPMRSYSRTRAWSDAQFDAAHDRLQQRGLVDATGFTPAGHSARESIEIHTDLQMDRALVGLADGLHDLLDLLLPWGAAVRDAKGYPASGPHDLAKAVRQ